MQKELRIVMLEDRAEDAVLTRDALRKSGMRFSFSYVDSREEFLRELDRGPDIILSDHGLPSFDGLTALRLAKEKCPEVPVVFVTGALGEEFAIRIFENGASDYVLKHHLYELAPAVRRALHMAEEARRHREEDEHLRRTSELFRNLVDGVTDYALYMLDPDGRITTWNRGAELVEGYTASEVLGRHIDVLFPPEEVARGKPRQILEHAARRGRYEEDGWRKRRDGSRVWMNVVLTAIRDSNTGELQGFVKVAHDLTEQKRAEEALRRSEERTRAILETALDAIVVMDANGTVREWNPAAERMFGFSRETAIGRPLADLIFPPYLRMRYATGLAQHFVEGGSPMLNRRTEAIAQRADGSEFPVELAITEARSEHETTFTGHIIDITERKHAEAQIRQLNTELEARVRKRTEQLELANRELEAFSYSVSHDLRAPLRHINGFVEILQSSAAETLDEESRGFLNTIADSARQMGRLIDDLLAFSRVGRAELRFIPVKLENLLAEAMREVRGELATRDVRWEIGPLPEVRGDPSMLRQVLVNLLSNALKYSRPRSPAVIQVKASESDSEHVISVSDNGVGFDATYASKLFGVFQRLHPAHEFEGTGIGLAIVRRVITRHGGKVWAEGEVDRGATFSFSLPKRAENAVNG